MPNGDKDKPKVPFFVDYVSFIGYNRPMPYEDRTKVYNELKKLSEEYPCQILIK